MNTTPLSNPLNLESVRSGQRIAVFAILLNLISYLLRMAIHHRGLAAMVDVVDGVIMLVTFLGFVLTIVGTSRIVSGLGLALAPSIFFFVLTILPFVGLMFLLGLSLRCTVVLRENGFKVGLFGAAKKSDGAQALETQDEVR